MEDRKKSESKEDEEFKGRLGRVGTIARFKPLHNGAYALLESLCSKSDHVIIGIGSANKYNARNPFTSEETEGMIRAALEKKFNNFNVIYIPDFAHIPEYKDGQKWREVVVEKFGSLDYFVSGNNFVNKLLEKDYKIIESYQVIPPEKRIKIKASRVRFEISVYGEWKKLVPPEVAVFLEKNGLIERFRKEFGLETIATLANVNLERGENMHEELVHARES